MAKTSLTTNMYSKNRSLLLIHCQRIWIVSQINTETVNKAENNLLFVPSSMDGYIHWNSQWFKEEPEHHDFRFKY